MSTSLIISQAAGSARSLGRTRRAGPRPAPHELMELALADRRRRALARGSTPTAPARRPSCARPEPGPTGLCSSAGSFSARQRSASDRSSQPMLRGASCQCGAPGTRPSAVFAVWWQVEHLSVGVPRSSGPARHQHPMAVPVVGLAREVPARVTVQAARMPQHLGDAPERLERGLAIDRRWRLGGRGRTVSGGHAQRPRAEQPRQAAPGYSVSSHRLDSSVQPGYADSKPCWVSGSDRTRRPVSANRALHTAAAISGVPGSPMPDGGSVLGTMCTSTSGICVDPEHGVVVEVALLHAPVLQRDLRRTARPTGRTRCRPPSAPGSSPG